MQSTKVCLTCGTEKPLVEFYVGRGSGANYRSHCKPCDRERALRVSKAVVEKRCARCHEMKPGGEFSIEYAAPDGLYSYCKPCRKERKREDPIKRPMWYVRSTRRQIGKITGMTYEEIQDRIEAQGGVCALCGRPPGVKALALDHDHETGRSRSMLCARCNQGIGHFRDDPDLLRRAADYLERWAEVGPQYPLFSVLSD